MTLLQHQSANDNPSRPPHTPTCGASGSWTPQRPSLPPEQHSPYRSPQKVNLVRRSGTNSSRKSADSGYASDRPSSLSDGVPPSESIHGLRSYAPRALGPEEASAAQAFIDHADKCWNCHRLGDKRQLKEELCATGLSLVQSLSQHLYLTKDGCLLGRRDDHPVCLGPELGPRYKLVAGWEELLDRKPSRIDNVIPILPSDYNPWNLPPRARARAGSVQKTPPPFGLPATVIEKDNAILQDPDKPMPSYGVRERHAGKSTRTPRDAGEQTELTLQVPASTRRSVLVGSFKPRFQPSETSLSQGQGTLSWPRRGLKKTADCGDMRTRFHNAAITRESSSTQDDEDLSRPRAGSVQHTMPDCALALAGYQAAKPHYPHRRLSRSSGTAEVAKSSKVVKESLETGFVKLSLEEDVDEVRVMEAVDGAESKDYSQKRSRRAPPATRGSRQRSKRVRGDDRDPGDGDDPSSGEDDDDDNDRPFRKGGQRREEGLPRLVCPFYKKDPIKYKNGGCRGRGFKDIARLKQHIQRVHTQPLRCPRCCVELKSDVALNAHLREARSCERRTKPPDDKISMAQLGELNFKRSPFKQASTEEKWRMMYNMLFPGEEVPSPYDEQGFTPHMERILEQTLNEELTNLLMPVVGAGSELRHVTKHIPSIIQIYKNKLARLSSESDTDLTPESQPTVSPTPSPEYSLPPRRGNQSLHLLPTPPVSSSESLQHSRNTSSSRSTFGSHSSPLASGSADQTRSNLGGSFEHIHSYNSYNQQAPIQQSSHPPVNPTAPLLDASNTSYVDDLYMDFPSDGIYSTLGRPNQMIGSVFTPDDGTAMDDWVMHTSPEHRGEAHWTPSLGFVREEDEVDQLFGG